MCLGFMQKVIEPKVEGWKHMELVFKIHCVEVGGFFWWYEAHGEGLVGVQSK
jgi:hypothetical protein